MPFAMQSICRSLCCSCGADSRDRAGGLPRWIFMASFLLKTHKAKDSSRRSLTVIAGGMLRLFMGDQVVTSENSRPAACFAMSFVQLQGWLSRSSKRTSPLNGYFYGTVLATKFTRMAAVGGNLWKNAQPSLFVGDRLATPESSRPTGVTNDCQRQMLMDAVVIMDCWWHLVQTRPKYGACAKFFIVSLVLFLFLSMSTSWYHVLVGRRQWNRVICLDTRCVRSVENHVPGADCATVSIHATGIVTLKTEIALQLSRYPETSMKRCEQDCWTRHVFTPEIQKIDRFLVKSWLMVGMIVRWFLQDCWRTWNFTATCSSFSVHCMLGTVRIAIMCCSSSGRLELSTNRHARTLSLVSSPPPPL